jgi:LEA14-like dessication related protein
MAAYDVHGRPSVAKHLIVIGLIAGVFGALGGCQETGRKKRYFDIVTAPTAQVVEVKILETSPQAVRVAVTVEMTNRDEVPLPLTIADYYVDLPGTKTYRSSQRPLATIPANGTQQFQLTAAVPTAGEAPATYRVGGTIEYEPPGEIRMLLTESGVPLPRVGFQGTGELTR